MDRSVWNLCKEEAMVVALVEQASRHYLVTCLSRLTFKVQALSIGSKICKQAALSTTVRE